MNPTLEQVRAEIARRKAAAAPVAPAAPAPTAPAPATGGLTLEAVRAEKARRAANGAGFTSTNPMEAAGIAAQRQALIGQRDAALQSKIQQVQAQRIPFQEEQVNRNDLMRGLNNQIDGLNPSRSTLGDYQANAPIANDVSKLAKTAGLNVWNGGVTATQAAINALPAAADWIGSFSHNADGSQAFKPQPKADLSRARMEISPEDQSLSGMLTEGFTQFLATRSLMGNGGGKFANGAKDTAALMSGFSGNSGRAADFVDPNVIPEGAAREFVQWLKTQPGDSDFMGRVKNGTEDFLVNLILHGAGNALGALKKPPGAPHLPIDVSTVDPLKVALGKETQAQAFDTAHATGVDPNALPTLNRAGGAFNSAERDAALNPHLPPARITPPTAAASGPSIPGGASQAAAQAGAASAGQQASPAVGGAGGAIPPNGGPATLQATPRRVPAAIDPEEVANNRAAVISISRFMRSARIPRNVVDDYVGSLLSRYEPLKSDRYPLAFFVEEDLPQYLQSRGYSPDKARNLAGDVAVKTNGYGKAANSFTGSGNSSRYTMQDTIHQLTSTQKTELDRTFKSVLGDETLMGRSDEIGALMRQNGQEAYTNSISEANRLLKTGKATPEQVKAASEINAILTNSGFKEFYPESLTIEATTRGKTVDELIQERLAADPIDTAHWLQSEIGQAARDAKNIDGSQTNMSRAYENMRKAILDRLEKFAGYKGARMQHGDLFGADEAISFGDRFLSDAKSEYKTEQMARALEKLSPRQQQVAALSIRDALLNQIIRLSPEEAPARITQLQNEGTLKALVTVLGEERGTELRNAIANMRVENQRIASVSQAHGSPTHLNQQGAKDAVDNLRGPGNRAVHAIGNPGGWAFAAGASALLGSPVPLAAKGLASIADKLSTPTAKFQSRATRGLYGLPKAAEDAAGALPDLPAAPVSGAPVSPGGGSGAGSGFGRTPQPRAQRPPPTVEEWGQRIEKDQNELQRLLKQYDQIDRADPNVDDLMRANLHKQQLARRRIADKTKKMEAARAAQPEPAAVPNAPQIEASAVNAEPQAVPVQNALGRRPLPGETSRASPTVAGALVGGGLGAVAPADSEDARIRNIAIGIGGGGAVGAFAGLKARPYGDMAPRGGKPRPPTPKPPIVKNGGGSLPMGEGARMAPGKVDIRLPQWMGKDGDQMYAGGGMRTLERNPSARTLDRIARDAGRVREGGLAQKPPPYVDLRWVKDADGNLYVGDANSNMHDLMVDGLSEAGVKMPEGRGDAWRYAESMDDPRLDQGGMYRRHQDGRWEILKGDMEWKPFDPAESGSSKLLAGMGQNGTGIGVAGGAIAGGALAPDTNKDGKIDAQERMAGAIGGAFTGGVTGKALGSAFGKARTLIPRANKLAGGVERAGFTSPRGQKGTPRANGIFGKPTVKPGAEPPTIALSDLKGARIFHTTADHTRTGGAYTGIDSSLVDNPVPLPGGPKYGLRSDNAEHGVAFANNGGVAGQKVTKITDHAATHMIINVGDANQHISSVTANRAFFDTMRAYVRDGRISQKNARAITKLIKGSVTKDDAIHAAMKAFPGFEDAKAFDDYARGLSFEGRKRLLTLVGSKEARDLGAPNLKRILDATRETETAGRRWGDGEYVVKLDPNGTLVKLGDGSAPEHPDFPTGIRGKVIGKLEAPLNYETLAQDWLASDKAAKLAANPNATLNQRRGFDMARPVIEVTDDLLSRIGDIKNAGIDSARQAKLTADFAADNWKVSGLQVKQGGSSPADFINAIDDSPGAAVLDVPDLSTLKKDIRSGKTSIYQLGDDGQVFFSLEKGDPGYEASYGVKTPGIGPNEVKLGGVINNELGAAGMGHAVMLKALTEGATVLDAFAVKSAAHPDGFLPEFYKKFGFEPVAEVPFDKKYYTPQKLADAVDFWKKSTKGYDPEIHGYPPLVIMKWTGTDAQRANLVAEYHGRGLQDLFPGRDQTHAATDWDVLGGDATGKTGKAGSGGRKARGAGGGQGHAGKPPVPSALTRATRGLSNLSDAELRNLGRTPADREAARRALGGMGSSRPKPAPANRLAVPKPKPVEARRPAPRGNKPFSDPRLSPGENKTAEMILNGYSYEEIADEMMTTVQVVGVQATKAQKKLGADVLLPRPGRGKRTPGSTKLDAAFELFDSGVLNAQIAERLGMPIANVRNYRSRWKEQGRAPVASVEGAMYNPPAMPERPFEADYPRSAWPDGPPVDAQGRLTQDMDRKPLAQNSVIIGRNKAPGYGQGSEADRPLRDRIAVIQTLKQTGSSIERVPRSTNKTSGGWAPHFDTNGRFTGRGSAQIVDDLDRPIAGLDDQEVIVLSHELAHSIDFKASPARNVGGFNDRKWGIEHNTPQMPPELKAEYQSQLERIYSDLNNPVDGEVTIRSPKDHGYDAIDADRELWAEAIRAYMYDPTYIKTVAPDVAFMIRDHVNRNSSLRKTISFNAIPTIVGVGGLGLGAMALSGQPAEAQRRRDGR